MSRMRKKKNLIPRMEKTSRYLVRTPEDMKGRWRNRSDKSFQRLFIELGCGKGAFACKVAATPVNDESTLFVGIDRVEEALVVGMEKASSFELDNLLFIRRDVQTLTDIFSPGEVNAIFINFCDPWPTKRHAKRRLTHTLFLKIYKDILSSDGIIEFKTDNEDLYNFSLAEFEINGFDLLVSSNNLPANITVPTEYEQKFRLAGQPIYYARVRPGLSFMSGTSQQITP